MDKPVKISTAPTNYNEGSLPLYTIGVASRLTNCSVHTIRLYEDRGLILPHRTNTNRRLYSQADIFRLNCIRKHLDEEGLNIAGIKALLAIVPCWKIRPCTEKDYISCDAYSSTTEPCWLATKKGAECIEQNCRSCSVYKMADQCPDVKTLYKNMLTVKSSDGE